MQIPSLIPRYIYLIHYHISIIQTNRGDGRRTMNGMNIILSCIFYCTVFVSFLLYWEVDILLWNMFRLFLMIPGKRAIYSDKSKLTACKSRNCIKIRTVTGKKLKTNARPIIPTLPYYTSLVSHNTQPHSNGPMWSTKITGSDMILMLLGKDLLPNSNRQLLVTFRVISIMRPSMGSSSK